MKITIYTHTNTHTGATCLCYCITCKEIVTEIQARKSHTCNVAWLMAYTQWTAFLQSFFNRNIDRKHINNFFKIFIVKNFHPNSAAFGSNFNPADIYIASEINDKVLTYPEGFNILIALYLLYACNGRLDGCRKW